MKEIPILGRNYEVIVKEAEDEYAELEGNALVVGGSKASAGDIMREFLAGLLYRLLWEIYEELKVRSGVEILGNLDFKVVEKIDGKRRRIAKLEGNKILVKINAILMPRFVIEYIVAHEVAHILYKRHTRKFWQLVTRLHPNYEESKRYMEENIHLIDLAV